MITVIVLGVNAP